jgi:uncharacterized membrane protein
MTLAGILTAILIIAIIGFVLWLIITYIPMPDPIRQVIIVVVVVLIIIWLISVIAGGLPPLKIR